MTRVPEDRKPLDAEDPLGRPAQTNATLDDQQMARYAATAVEAGLAAGKEVIVVGGGNSAGQAALYLARSAAHVHILIRGTMPSPYETAVPGVFAVGDVRAGSVKRVASAVGEGSVVIQAIHLFLGGD